MQTRKKPRVGVAPATYRDRITEYKKIRCADLNPNPLNWRQHGEQQKAAMTGILREVGIVDALLVRDVGDGSFDIIDGHMRAGLMPNDELPCLVLDVDEDEARKILLTFDPIGAMADASSVNLAELLKDAEFSDIALQELVSKLAEDAGVLGDLAGENEDKYTRTVAAPIYRPTGPKPQISDLVDTSKADVLSKQIEDSTLPDDAKVFLRLAAQRHVRFNYEQIAEWYAHSDEQTKCLMEDSALVIIDFDKAIELGYVQLSKRLSELYGEEYGVE